MEFIELSAQQRFSIIQQKLYDLGYLTYIKRIITGKVYDVIVNGEVKKQYKTRRSSKNYITKLFNKINDGKER